MADCFECGEELYAYQEWRLNPKYVAGTTVTKIRGDEYGHKQCVDEVQDSDE